MVKTLIVSAFISDLVVDNSQTKATLDFKNPYSVEEGIGVWFKVEKK